MPEYFYMQSNFIFVCQSIFMCNPNLFLNARVFLRALFCGMIVTIFRADEKISPKAVLIRFWGCFVTNRSRAQVVIAPQISFG